MNAFNFNRFTFISNCGTSFTLCIENTKIMENKTQSSVPPTRYSSMSDACLFVAGEIYTGGYSLFGTDVTLFENDVVSQKFICCLNGFFYFRLDYGKVYSIKVSKNDFETKTIVIDTNIENLVRRNKRYEFGVMLTKNEYTQNVNLSVEPSAIIRYSSKTNEFEHDAEYAKLRKQMAMNANKAA
jgi:hypothetical protein